MNIIQGDIWKLHNQSAGEWIAITTNGYVRKNGLAVMGRGTALQAKQKFPDIQRILGDRIQEEGNHVFTLHKYGIFTFPVKYIWSEKADLELIRQSCFELNDRIAKLDNVNKVYLPKPGCGNGQLLWSSVKPVCEALLCDKVWIVEYKPI